MCPVKLLLLCPLNDPYGVSSSAPYTAPLEEPLFAALSWPCLEKAQEGEQLLKREGRDSQHGKEDGGCVTTVHLGVL